MSIPATPAQPLAGLYILLVEQHPIFAQELVVLMRQAGAADAEYVTSVAQAHRRLSQSPIPQLVLIAAQVSDLSASIALAEWMCGQPTLQRSVRIALSDTPRP